jgi:uncharacterized membrane protein YkvA (DUF1232 family)
MVAGILARSLRLAPDVVRLLKRLARDKSVPIGVRIWLAVRVVCLVSPIDLIPDLSRVARTSIRIVRVTSCW